jgi:hypothetical protein
VKPALWVALAAALALSGGAAAATKTGQAPGCERFCMSVKPAQGPEGSVFRFHGRGWRPERRVFITFGAYCRPNEACLAIAYLVRVRTDSRGRFVFRLRAGAEQPGDDRAGIHAGGRPTFGQRARSGRGITRSPRYRVILPD